MKKYLSFMAFALIAVFSLACARRSMFSQLGR